MENSAEKKQETLLELLIKNDKLTHKGYLKPEEVEELRTKHNQKQGWINHIFVYEDETTMVHSYFKKADKFTMARAISLHAQDKILESGECILVNCFIGGDERVKTDEDLLIATSIKLTNATHYHGGALENV